MPPTSEPIRLSDQLAAQEERLKSKYRAGTPANEIVVQRTEAIDEILIQLLKPELGSSVSGLCLVALGGYGRRELNRYSDIDLMILYENIREENLKPIVQKILYPFWDAHFLVQATTRNLDDCRKMMEEDLKSQTALLEARAVFPQEHPLFEGLQELLKKKWRFPFQKKAFAQGKWKEHEGRTKKFGDSVCLLEPQIKEGEGGLREYHTWYWIARCFHGEEVEVQQDWEPELNFLWKLRDALHELEERRFDRLTFRAQDELAPKLGFQSSSELMRTYYREAGSLKNGCRSALEKFLGRRLTMGISKIPSAESVARHPKELCGFFTALHERGLWPKYFPEMSHWVGLTIRDAYHIYTVDMHTLKALQFVDGLAHGKESLADLKLGPIYDDLKNPHLLFWALLFHDSGKGLGDADHALAGAEIAKKVLTRLRFTAAEVATVDLLVRSHVILTRMAFLKDTEDPALLSHLATSLENREQLDLLYLLSLADLSAVSKEVLTSWKKSLLAQLHDRLTQILEGTRPEDLWLRPPIEFLEKTEKLVRRYLKEGPTFLTREETTRDGSYTDFSIVTKDAPGLFANICGCLAYRGINILEARIDTSWEGVVVDHFKLVDAQGLPIEDELRWASLQEDLAHVFAGLADVRKLLAKSKPSKWVEAGRSWPEVSPKVSLDNESSALYSLLEVEGPDRIGLLHDVALVLFENGFNIQKAKITTEGHKAIDSFYVNLPDQRKLVDFAAWKKVQQVLLEVLRR